jgi:hypothetical protein
MSQPRRSARIAAKNESKALPTSFTLIMEPNPQPTLGLSDRDLRRLKQSMPAYRTKPTSMKEIEMELDEYWELNDGSELSIPHPSLCFSSNDSAEKSMTAMNVSQERYRYLLQKSYLLEFFNEDMMDDLREQIETFLVDYEDWTQELEKQMIKAVRNNKHWPISPTDPHTSFPVMSTIRKASTIHNQFVFLYEDVMNIKYLIKNQKK